MKKIIKEVLSEDQSDVLTMMNTIKSSQNNNTLANKQNFKIRSQFYFLELLKKVLEYSDGSIKSTIDVNSYKSNPFSINEYMGALCNNLKQYLTVGTNVSQLNTAATTAYDVGDFTLLARLNENIENVKKKGFSEEFKGFYDAVIKDYFYQNPPADSTSGMPTSFKDHVNKAIPSLPMGFIEKNLGKVQKVARYVDGADPVNNPLSDCYFFFGPSSTFSNGDKKYIKMRFTPNFILQRSSGNSIYSEIREDSNVSDIGGDSKRVSGSTHLALKFPDNKLYFTDGNKTYQIENPSDYQAALDILYNKMTSGTQDAPSRSPALSHVKYPDKVIYGPDFYDNFYFIENGSNKTPWPGSNLLPLKVVIDVGSRGNEAFYLDMSPFMIPVIPKGQTYGAELLSGAGGSFMDTYFTTWWSSDDTVTPGRTSLENIKNSYQFFDAYLDSESDEEEADTFSKWLTNTIAVVSITGIFDYDKWSTDTRNKPSSNIFLEKTKYHTKMYKDTEAISEKISEVLVFVDGLTNKLKVAPDYIRTRMEKIVGMINAKSIYDAASIVITLEEIQADIKSIAQLVVDAHNKVPLGIVSSSAESVKSNAENVENVASNYYDFYRIQLTTQVKNTDIKVLEDNADAQGSSMQEGKTLRKLRSMIRELLIERSQKPNIIKEDSGSESDLIRKKIDGFIKKAKTGYTTESDKVKDYYVDANNKAKIKQVFGRMYPEEKTAINAISSSSTDSEANKKKAGLAFSNLVASYAKKVEKEDKQISNRQAFADALYKATNPKEARWENWFPNDKAIAKSDPGVIKFYNWCYAGSSNNNVKEIASSLNSTLKESDVEILKAIFEGGDVTYTPRGSNATKTVKIDSQARDYLKTPGAQNYYKIDVTGDKGSIVSGGGTVESRATGDDRDTEEYTFDQSLKVDLKKAEVTYGRVGTFLRAAVHLGEASYGMVNESIAIDKEETRVRSAIRKLLKEQQDSGANEFDERINIAKDINPDVEAILKANIDPMKKIKRDLGKRHLDVFIGSLLAFEKETPGDTDNIKKALEVAEASAGAEAFINLRKSEMHLEKPISWEEGLDDEIPFDDNNNTYGDLGFVESDSESYYPRASIVYYFYLAKKIGDPMIVSLEQNEGPFAEYMDSAPSIKAKKYKEIKTDFESNNNSTNYGGSIGLVLGSAIAADIDIAAAEEKRARESARAQSSVINKVLQPGILGNTIWAIFSKYSAPNAPLFAVCIKDKKGEDGFEGYTYTKANIGSEGVKTNVIGRVKQLANEEDGLDTIEKVLIEKVLCGSADAAYHQPAGSGKLGVDGSLAGNDWVTDTKDIAVREGMTMRYLDLVKKHKNDKSDQEYKSVMEFIKEYLYSKGEYEVWEDITSSRGSVLVSSNVELNKQIKNTNRRGFESFISDMDEVANQKGLRKGENVSFELVSDRKGPRLVSNVPKHQAIFDENLQLATTLQTLVGSDGGELARQSSKIKKTDTNSNEMKKKRIEIPTDYEAYINTMDGTIYNTIGIGNIGDNTNPKYLPFLFEEQFYAIVVKYIMDQIDSDDRRQVRKATRSLYGKEAGDINLKNQYTQYKAKYNAYMSSAAPKEVARAGGKIDDFKKELTTFNRGMRSAESKYQDGSDAPVFFKFRSEKDGKITSGSEKHVDIPLSSKRLKRGEKSIDTRVKNLSFTFRFDQGISQNLYGDFLQPIISSFSVNGKSPASGSANVNMIFERASQGINKLVERHEALYEIYVRNKIRTVLRERVKKKIKNLIFEKYKPGDVFMMDLPKKKKLKMGDLEKDTFGNTIKTDAVVPTSVETPQTSPAHTGTVVAENLTDPIVEVLEYGPGYNIVKLASGKIVKRRGSRNWRNNNPGNIEQGEFMVNRGSLGDDGRFAIMPTYAAGRQAKYDLLFKSDNYKDLTISGAITRYAPPSENDTNSYIANVKSVLTRTDVDTVTMSGLTEDERISVLNEMERVEGFRAGTVIELSSYP